MKTLSLFLAIFLFVGIALFTIFFLEIVSFISISLFVGLLIYFTIDAIYCVILEKYDSLANLAGKMLIKLFEAGLIKFNK